MKHKVLNQIPTVKGRVSSSEIDFKRERREREFIQQDKILSLRLSQMAVSHRLMSLRTLAFFFFF